MTNKLQLIYPKQASSEYFLKGGLKTCKGLAKNDKSGTPCEYISTNSKKQDGVDVVNVFVEKFGDGTKITEEFPNGKVVQQVLGKDLKATRIVNNLNGNIYESIHTINNDTGEYLVNRNVTKNGKLQHHSIVLAEPMNRKFLSGIKGKLQKLMLTISNDANGCERTIVRKFAAPLLKIIK